MTKLSKVYLAMRPAATIGSSGGGGRAADMASSAVGLEVSLRWREWSERPRDSGALLRGSGRAVSGREPRGSVDSADAADGSADGGVRKAGRDDDLESDGLADDLGDGVGHEDRKRESIQSRAKSEATPTE